MRFLLRRWLLVAFIAEAPMALGYDRVGAALWQQVALAAAAWLFGFDFARARQLRFIEDIVRTERARVALFVVAVLSAVVVIVGGTNVRVVDAGTATLYAVMGATIARQGWRIGGRRLAPWEVRDELLYGALGVVIAMCVAGCAVVVVGDRLGVIELLLLVSPIGVIAMSDEPLYPTRHRYAKRFFIRQHRRMVLGMADETW